LSRFAIDGEDGGIVDLFLETLDNEQNAVCEIVLNSFPVPSIRYVHLVVSNCDLVSFLKEVRMAIVFSLPPSNNTLESVVESMLDISESVRRAAYSVLSTKFPLQSLT
jgi:condensin complex subunit 3